MTILFFSRRFYPLIGGVEKHVFEISKRLIKKGHKVIVITEYEKNTNDSAYQSLSSSARVEGIKILRVNVGSNNKFKKFRIWLQLLKHLQLIKSADIVHCHDVFFWYLPFRFLFPFKKVYTTFHGYEGNDLPTKKAIFSHKLAEKLSFGNICVGDFLKKWYGTKPTVVTYGAVDKKLIEQGIKNIKSTKEAVFLGRLEQETGIMEYLKALVVLKNKNINIQMDVLGDGFLKEEAKRYVAKNKLKVNFKGFIPNATDYLKDYKYVFTSRYLGILEAMALRKPIFTEYNNNIKKDYLEMAPFAGFVSISRNGEEISNNFQDLINGKSRIDVDKAYTFVKTETWDKMTKTYLKLWSLL